MNTAELLTRRLELVYRWHQGMINPDTGMLEYLYMPETDTFVREKCPIRDIAAVWAVEKLERFLYRRELLPMITKSLEHYESYVTRRNEFRILDPGRLDEPSSIAHSAFMILALLYALPRCHIRQITDLAEGILRQQRSDGSYKIYFDDLTDQGEELYAGEAMLALMEGYRQLHNSRFLRSVERAFSYYDTHYFREDRVGEDVLIFFANWQSQACRLLFESTRNDGLRKDAAGYLFQMHDRIVAQGFYDDVERQPNQQLSVEVASALEGLNDAYSVACRCGDERAELYRRCICAAIEYLLKLQCVQNGRERERGGFGLSLDSRKQRIDIAGHAASAFMKSVENNIESQELSPKAA